MIKALAATGFLLQKIMFSKAGTIVPSQQTNTCSKSTIKTVEAGAKYIQI